MYRPFGKTEKLPTKHTLYKRMRYTVVLWFIFQCMFIHNMMSTLGTIILDGLGLHIAPSGLQHFQRVALLTFTDSLASPEHYLRDLMIIKMGVYSRPPVGTVGKMSESIFPSF